VNEQPRTDPTKAIYRLTLCASCKRDTWHEWSIGHLWTCACGAVRIEDVWNHHEQQEQLTDAPVIQLALI